MEPNQEMNKGKVCNCSHHKVVPIVIIVIGLAILLAAFNIFSSFAEVVTIGIAFVVIGFTKLFSRKCGCC